MTWILHGATEIWANERRNAEEGKRRTYCAELDHSHRTKSNNIKRTWAYDTFGRLQKEHSKKVTATETLYNFSTPWEIDPWINASIDAFRCRRSNWKTKKKKRLEFDLNLKDYHLHPSAGYVLYRKTVCVLLHRGLQIIHRRHGLIKLHNYLLMVH